MTHILFLSSSTGQQGGAELCLFKLVCHFRGRARVVLPKREGIAHRYEAEGIPVSYIPVKGLRRSGSLRYQLSYLISVFPSVLELVRLIRSGEIELAHVNEFIDLLGLVAGRIAGVKTVCHVRYILERPFWMRWFLARVITCLSTRIICVSEAVREQMFGETGADRGSISVIYDGGPDLDRFSPDARRRRMIREQYGLSEDVCLVGLVSKLVEVKGHDYLLNAAQETSSQDLRKIQFMIVGGEVEGHEEYAEHLQRRIGREGLGEVVTLAGYQEDIPAFMDAFDVFVHLPANEDPFPGVVLEAMAMMKPIVAFESGGIPEQVDDGESGLLIPKGDSAALVERIIMLSDRGALRRQLGECARARLEQKFFIGRHVAQVSAVYEDLIRDED